MKKNIVFNLLFFIAITSFAQKGMKFETGTWAQIQEKAKNENKFIFVDAYTTWCGPCKWMAKNIFTNDTVGEFYNKNFINAKIDMEKGEGIELAKKYEVKFYPTYLFLDSNGELVHRSGSSKPVKMFIEDGENAINPKKQLITLQKKYDAGDKSEALVKNYAIASAKIYSKNDALAVDYIAVSNQEELFTNDNFNVLYALAELDKKGSEFLFKNAESYRKVVGTEKYDEAIIGLFFEESWNAGKDKDEKKFSKLKEINTTFFPTIADKNTLKMRLIYLEGAKNIDELFEVYTKYFKSFEKEISAEEYNNAAWFSFEKIEDKEKLKTALSWANKSIALEKSAMNMDTKANLEFKIGNYKEAKQTATETIEILKKEGGDTKSMQDLIKEINQKLK
ncbi:MAG: thioredoxin family protein [Bacteroidota bacterium]